MGRPLESIYTGVQQLHRGLDWLSHQLALYGVSAAIFAVSLVALFVWPDLYTSNPEKHLDLRARVQTEEALSLAEASQALRTEADTQFFNTRLTQRPVWFAFATPQSTIPGHVVEFPSRHAVSLACWNAQTLVPLGDSAHLSPSGRFFDAKAGYALRLTPDVKEVICRGEYVGPARIDVELWTAQGLEVSIRDFHRRSGLVDGGMMMLALFVLVSAAFNRRPIFVIFSAWLFLTVRLSATAGGWDFQWLNHAVPEVWLSDGRSLTRAAWALLTLALFKQLFLEDLTRMRYLMAVTIMQWMAMLLLVAALVLPRTLFLPTLWVLGGIWLAFVIFCLAVIVVRTRSNVSLLYAGAMGVMLGSTLYEIFAASLSTRGLDSSSYGVVVALTSSLLISLAIAEQMRQEHRARLAVQDHLQHTYEGIPIGMFTLDLQGRFLSINPALRKMLGPRAFRSAHNTWQQYFGAGVWQMLLELVQNDPEGEMEFATQLDVKGNEAPRRFLIKAALAGDKIEGSLQDVTEKSLAMDELGFLADNDALTKVLNRRGLEKLLQTLVDQMDDEHPLALAYLDLDRFKLINDLYGHNAGDEVLRQVCQRVNGLLAAHMRLARVGGDEFVILMPGTRMPLAKVICRGIVDSIDNTPFRVGEKAFHVRGSIGLIEVPQGAQLNEVLSTADHACRDAKTGQHRGLVVYEQDSPAFREHQAELRLIGEISASESIPGLYLEMQPIMSLTRPHDALNFEVLLRMRDQAGAPVPVGRLISAAESCGRMSMIDRWVLSSSLAWLDVNRARLQRTQFVCINLSGASLNDEEFMHEVFEILRRNSHVSSFLSIEITESVALHDLKNTRRFIDRVRGFGARVALDDFGAGYTSFSYLKELPADLLKIDGSFVVNMNQHPANVSIVEAIVNLARNLGMKTIAEWAEDAATVQALADIGVDYVQGYAVARPMAPDRLLEAGASSSFIKDPELLRFIDTIDRQNNPLAQLDLLHEGDKTPSRKIH